MHAGLEYILKEAGLEASPDLLIDQSRDDDYYSFLFQRKVGDHLEFLKTVRLYGSKYQHIPGALRNKREAEYDLATADKWCVEYDVRNREQLRKKVDFLTKVRANPAYLSDSKDARHLLEEAGFEDINEFVAYGFKKKDPRLLTAANLEGYVITPHIRHDSKFLKSTTGFDTHMGLLLIFTKSYQLPIHFALHGRTDLVKKFMDDMPKDLWPQLNSRIQDMCKRVDPDKFKVILKHRPKTDAGPLEYGGDHLTQTEREVLARSVQNQLTSVATLDDPLLRAMCKAGACTNLLLHQAVYKGNTEWEEALIQRRPDYYYEELVRMTTIPPSQQKPRFSAWTWPQQAWPKAVAIAQKRPGWPELSEKLLQYVGEEVSKPHHTQATISGWRNTARLIAYTLSEQDWKTKGDAIIKAYPDESFHTMLEEIRKQATPVTEPEVAEGLNTTLDLA